MTRNKWLNKRVKIKAEKYGGMQTEHDISNGTSEYAWPQSVTSLIAGRGITICIILRLMVYVMILMSLGIINASASLLVTDEGMAPGRSAEYTRTQSRNSSTDTDALFYNPAGLVFLQNGGLYITLNSQNAYMLKNCSIGLWGQQGIDAINNFTIPIASRFQSPSLYVSKIITAMPSDIGFIFKRENWSVFCHVATLYGQPGATYTQGASLLDRMAVAYNSVVASRLSQQLVNVYSQSYFKRKELHIGATAGGSYAFTDRGSGSLAVRYINIQSNTKVSQIPLHVQMSGGTDISNLQVPTFIDTDVYGHGLGLIFGADFKPVEKINIGLRIEYYAPMQLNKKTNRFITNPVLAQTGMLNIFCDGVSPLVINDRLNTNGLGRIFNIVTMDYRTIKRIGNKTKATYPPSVSIGMSYRITPWIKIDTSADLTFPRARDLDGEERNWKYIGYRLGQSIEWQIVPWIAASVGYSYHDYGINPNMLTSYDDLLSSHTMGAGCTLKPLDFLDITIGSSYSFYMSSKKNMYDVLSSTLLGDQFVYGQMWNQKLSRNEWCVSLGVTFLIMPVSVDHRKKAEEHYWKGMSLYLSNDIDSALEEFKTAKSHNAYYRDVGKKVKEIAELQKIMKKNIDQDQKEEDENRKNNK